MAGESEGARLLAEILVRRDIPVVEAARQLGVAQSTLWRVLKSGQRPSITLVIAAEDLFGVGIRLWAKGGVSRRTKKAA